MDAAFWRDRRVLVTGHTGFKGSWLALWLEQLGAQVVGYSLDPPTTPSLFCWANVGRSLTHVVGDIGDAARLARVVADEEIEIILHLAAQPLVRKSYVEPAATYATNVLGTVNVLEAARLHSTVRSVVIVTTDKCYENREWVWGYREHEPLGGHDPYSSSKACAELVAAAYRQSYFQHATSRVGVATVRAGNVIGGGDWAQDRLVPDAIRALSQGEPLRVRRPAAVRPWQHVLEPLRGYLMIAERLYREPRRWDSAWNFGPLAQDTAPVARLAEQLVAAWGEGTWINEAEEQGPHEAHWLQLDISKAQQILGWTPRLNLSQGVALTVSWYRDVLRDGLNPREVTLRQIAEYAGPAGTARKRTNSRQKRVA